ncbi:MAG TPA: alkaline phosphatase D family protein [Vicinamibacterales bacterium]|nr:alkaline phosphatase D family protein [Vicinamibacterales bacterium]
MRLLRLSILLVACAAVTTVSGQQAPITITHGPILGRLDSTQVGVWVRTSRPATFHVHYGTDEQHLDQVSPAGTTEISHDNTGWVLIKGLHPNTKYFYQVLVGDASAPVRPDGSFLTLPSADDYRNAKYNPKGLFNFRFEYGTGNNQRPMGEGPWPPAFKTMLDKLKDKVYFELQNGDFIYEEKRDYPVKDWLTQVGLTAGQAPRIVNLVPSIVGVWENYKLYLERGKALAAWHRNMPAMFVWDDHEVLDNIDGTGTVGRRNRKAVFRDIGTRAWYDYIGWSNPVPPGDVQFGKAQLKAGSNVLTDPRADFTKLSVEDKDPGELEVAWGGLAAGVPQKNLDHLPGIEGDPNANVYQIMQTIDAHHLRVRPAAKSNDEATYSIGRESYFERRIGNVDMFVLDTRGHRDVSDTSHANRPNLTMLGARQKAWLKDRMRKSDADIFFVVTGVTFMIPHTGGTPKANASEANAGAAAAPKHDEAWTGFINEREELIRFWESLGKNVFVLSGDVHNSFSIKITDRIWELASGPHNSRNHRADAEGNPPPNGIFDSVGRKCEIRWSSYFLPDVPAPLVRQPIYTVIQINNVFDNKIEPNTHRWIAYPHPQVVAQWYDGFTGDLLYAESILVDE